MVTNIKSKKTTIIILAIAFCVAVCAITFILIGYRHFFVGSCDSRAELSRLLCVDIKDSEITDMQFKISRKATHILMFIKNPSQKIEEQFGNPNIEEEFPEDEYLKDEYLSKDYLANIGIRFGIKINKENLKGYGKLQKYDLEKHKGYRHIIPYTVDWFQFKEPYDERGDVIVFIYLPYPAIVDVKKIMAE